MCEPQTSAGTHYNCALCACCHHKDLGTNPYLSGSAMKESHKRRTSGSVASCTDETRACMNKTAITVKGTRHRRPVQKGPALQVLQAGATLHMHTNACFHCTKLLAESRYTSEARRQRATTRPSASACQAMVHPAPETW